MTLVVFFCQLGNWDTLFILLDRIPQSNAMLMMQKYATGTGSVRWNSHHVGVGEEERSG